MRRKNGFGAFHVTGLKGAQAETLYCEYPDIPVQMRVSFVNTARARSRSGQTRAGQRTGKGDKKAVEMHTLVLQSRGVMGQKPPHAAALLRMTVFKATSASWEPRFFLQDDTSYHLTERR